MGLKTVDTLSGTGRVSFASGRAADLAYRIDVRRKMLHDPVGPDLDGLLDYSGAVCMPALMDPADWSEFELELQDGARIKVSPAYGDLLAGGWTRITVSDAADLESRY